MRHYTDLELNWRLMVSAEERIPGNIHTKMRSSVSYGKQHHIKKNQVLDKWLITYNFCQNNVERFSSLWVCFLILHTVQYIYLHKRVYSAEQRTGSPSWQSDLFFLCLSRSFLLCFPSLPPFFPDLSHFAHPFPLNWYARQPSSRCFEGNTLFLQRGPWADVNSIMSAWAGQDKMERKQNMAPNWRRHST